MLLERCLDASTDNGERARWRQAVSPKLTLKFQQTMKPMVARFDMNHASTDGGAILLKVLDERLMLTGNIGGPPIGLA